MLDKLREGLYPPFSRPTKNRINNLILLANPRLNKNSNLVIESSKNVDTHYMTLEDQHLRWNLRGRSWNSVVLVGLTEDLLKNEYEDIYLALKNSCVMLDTKLLEV